MAGLLNKSGDTRLMRTPEKADTVIVNTCAFIEPAREESIETILTLAQQKKKGESEFRLIVAGCLAQRYGKELLDEIPEVDL